MITTDTVYRLGEEWPGAGHPLSRGGKGDSEDLLRFLGNPEVQPITFNCPENQICAQDSLAGVAAGLDSHMELGKAAADFYILERLMTDLWPCSDDVRVATGTFPKGFGTDSKLENLAYTVQKDYTALEDKLARELSTYLVMAIGGELRHAPNHSGPGGECQHSCEDDCAWEVDSDYCGHMCDEDCYDLTCEDPDCPHEDRYGCFNDDCGMNVCEHECSYDTGCIRWFCNHECDGEEECHEQVGPIFADELQEFWDMRLDGNSSRAFHWEQWWQEYQRRKNTSLIRRAADVFLYENWEGGYGGDSWGTAAKVVADYLDGKMSKRTFVDRCWTMHHNGGCIFNKFYKQVYVRYIEAYANGPSHISLGNSPCTKLDVVLALQAVRPYTKLAELASLGVQRLYTATNKALGKEVTWETTAA